MKTEVEADLEKRAEKSISKTSDKRLLIKQRKLLTAARMNNLQLVRGTQFTYFENDVNARDEKGNTSLYYAAKHGNLEFCQFLVDRGARVNEPCEKGNTPLHMAFFSDKEGVRLFITRVHSILNDILCTRLSCYCSYKEEI